MATIAISIDLPPVGELETSGDGTSPTDAQMDEEKQARQKLTSEWGQYSQAAKSSCIKETNIGTPSYVELQTCLEMAKWAERRQ